MFETLPPDLVNLIPGAIGAGGAAGISKLTNKDQDWRLLSIKAIIGTAAAFYGAVPAAKYLGWMDAVGLVRLLLGLFAMAAIIKVWDIIDSIQASELFVTFRDWARQKAGLPPKGSQ